jgi:hypothetical protein
MDVSILESCARTQPPALGLRSHRHVRGHGPHQGPPCPGHGDHDLRGLLALGHEVARPLAEPDLGCPADRLERWGARCQAPLEMTTDRGGLARRPGACDQRTTRRRMPRLGHAARLTPRPPRICRGGEPEIMHEVSGVLDARQVAACRHRGHRDRELDAAQRLERCDHGRQAPGLHGRVACLLQTWPASRLCGDGLDVCLKDQLRRRGGTADRAEPAPVGGAPGGPPGRAASVSQPDGCEPPRGRLQIPPGIVPCPTAVAEGCIVDGGDVDRGEGSRAPEPGQWPGRPPVGVHPLPRRFRQQGRGHAPTDVACMHQGARAPGAAGAGVVDADQRRTLRPQVPEPLVTIARPCADRAAGDDRRTRCWGDRGDRDGGFVDSQADVERARRRQG